MSPALPPFDTPATHVEAQNLLRGCMAIRAIARRRLQAIYDDPNSLQIDKDHASSFFGAARADLACAIRAVEKMLGKSYGLDRPRSLLQPKAPVFYLVDARSR